MDLTWMITPYAGYAIRPRPFHRQGGEWTLDVEIWRDASSGLAVHQFRGLETFPSQGAAVAACLQYARDIIDGRVPGLSVVDA